MVVDLQRIFTNEVGGHGFMNVRFDGTGTHESFPKTNQPFIGMDSNPDDIGKSVQPNGFNFCHFHSVP